MTNPNRPWWKRRNVQLLVLVLLIVGAANLLLLPSRSQPAPRKVPLSSAVADITAGKVSAAKVDDQANTVVLSLAQPAAVPAARRAESVTYPFAYSGELTKLMLAHNVKVTTGTVAKSNPWLGLLQSFGPLLLIMAFLMYLVKSGALTGKFGKFAGKRGQSLGDVPKERFSDVAGADEAVAELRELVEFLKDGDRFTRLGAKPPKGGLLAGPPGTGKTLLARAVAGEAGVPFFALAGSDFVEVFAGVGAKRARDLFDRANKAGKAIIFIDEIDAVAKRRSDAGGHGGEREGEQTLLALLSEMDGFSASNVIVLAATNRPDVLDPAITRPGRLDRTIVVGNPDRRGRTAILEVHTQGKNLAADVDLVAVARQTPGMSGAELAQVVNEACMEAARHEREQVTSADFHAAVPTVTMGRSRDSAIVTEQDRLVTAWHESGHTLTALLQPEAPDPVSVTIIPRGPSGGATHLLGDDSQFLSRKQALAQLTTALGGRAAELLLLEGEFTQGAGSDLAAATGLAQRMVSEYGMTGFGLAAMPADIYQSAGPVGERAWGAVNTLLTEALDRASALLVEHRPLLEAVAEALLVEETLSAARLAELQAQFA